jgi:hypothetical protein
LVYVYCENDFEKGREHGTPREVVSWLKDFAAREGIDDVTVVFAPYIFNIFPQMTRVRGTRGWNHPYHPETTERLQREVEKADLGWVDIGRVAEREAEDRNSVFGGLGLFVDVVHLSPAGSALVADSIVGRDSVDQDRG